MVWTDFLNTTHENSIKISFLNIGFGDCILIQSAGGNILVDYRHNLVNREAEYIRNYLTSAGVGIGETEGKIDYLIITHYHSDHFLGVQSLIDLFEIPDNRVLVSPYKNTAVVLGSGDPFATSPNTFTDILPGAPNIRVGNQLELIFFAPTQTILNYYNLHPDAAPNDSSIGFILSCKTPDPTPIEFARVLFPGDMETDAWTSVIHPAVGSPFDLSCDIYKCAHHGAGNGTPALLINGMAHKPSICVALDHEKEAQTRFERAAIQNVMQLIEAGITKRSDIGRIFNLHENTRQMGLRRYPTGAILLDIIPPSESRRTKKINCHYIRLNDNGSIQARAQPKPLASYKRERIPQWAADKSSIEEYNTIEDIIGNYMRELYSMCGKTFII